MIRVRNLESGYGALRVLKGVSLHVDKGEIVTIIGANGAGKSTLLKTLASIVRPRSGTILLNRAPVVRSSAETIVAMGCSLVPEGRHVFGAMTVVENLALGAYIQYKRGKKYEIEEDLPYVFSIFPTLLARKTQLAGTLSGGEQQMLAMARALMARPGMLMLDEPSMGLAPLMVKELFSVVRRLRDEGKTILLVEQNAKAALGVADRGYVLETGRIVLEGASRELLDNKDVQRAYLGKEYRKINE